MSTRTAKQPISLRRIFRLLLMVFCLAVLTFLLIIPVGLSWSNAHTLSTALTNPRSVSLVEFERSPHGTELVFHRVTATPAQIDALRAATSAWYAPISLLRNNCFAPHHRVEIVRADGTA